MLVGKHAFLSASQYHWIRYSDEKLIDRYINWKDAERGTQLHNLAHDLIRLKVRMGKSRKTLNMYVNDAIGFRMTPEQPLVYSEHAFGTADAISFNKDFLRIHDLKTGVGKSSMDQLLVYTALFCLEYRVKPGSIKTELRIYQNDEVLIHIPETDEIVQVINTIIKFDKMIDQLSIPDL